MLVAPPPNQIGTHKGSKNAPQISGGEEGDAGYCQHKDQGRVVLTAGVSDEDAAGVKCGGQEEDGHRQVAGETGKGGIPLVGLAAKGAETGGRWHDLNSF